MGFCSLAVLWTVEAVFEIGTVGRAIGGAKEAGAAGKVVWADTWGEGWTAGLLAVWVVSEVGTEVGGIWTGGNWTLLEPEDLVGVDASTELELSLVLS